MADINLINLHLAKAEDVYRKADGKLGGSALDYAGCLGMFSRLFDLIHKGLDSPLYGDERSPQIRRASALLKCLTLEATLAAATAPPPFPKADLVPLQAGDLVVYLPTDAQHTIGAVSEDGTQVFFYGDQAVEPAEAEDCEVVTRGSVEAARNMLELAVKDKDPRRAQWAQAGLKKLGEAPVGEPKADAAESAGKGGKRRKAAG